MTLSMKSVLETVKEQEEEEVSFHVERRKEARGDVVEEPRGRPNPTFPSSPFPFQRGEREEQDGKR